MADETVVDDQTQQTVAVDPQIEAEARRGGWKPKDQWRGDSSGWVDAKTFVDRGRQILPHVRAHAAQLEQENAALKAAQAEQARELQEMKQQVTGLTTFQAEMAEQQRRRMRAEILDELQQARAAGDFSAEARALDKLTRQPAAVEPPKPAPVAAPTPAAPATPQIPQELRDWTASNDWYRQDPVLQQAMNVVGADLRASGRLVGMSLTEQLNATAKVVLERYAPAPVNGGNRVEGSRPSGEGGGMRPAPTTGYESLPAHIKQECDAQGDRLGLVGEKKLFKTVQAWREHYAKEYNRYTPGAGYDYRPPGN